MISVAELFKAVGLNNHLSVNWGDSVHEYGSGVYVIVEKPRRIIYIGKSKNIAKRLRQFYRHKYGAKAPHRGGQEILSEQALAGRKVEEIYEVYWASVSKFADVESLMIAKFYEIEGRLPYGNKISGRRIK